MVAKFSSCARRALVPVFALMLTACSSGSGDGDAANGVVISGALTVPVYVLTDIDVNDVNVLNGSNDSPTTAQPVPNPVNVGGYVNTPQTGATGNTFTNGDLSDFYEVELEADQTLLLNIGENTDGGPNDLDLALYDESILTDVNADPVASSEGISRFESIIVATAGTYYVRVYPYRGGAFSRQNNSANYLLSIGLTPVSELQQFRGAEHADFVVGDIIAKPKATARFGALSKATVPAGIEISQTAAEGPMLMQLAASKQAAFSAQTTATSDDVSLRKETLRAIETLQSSGDYDYVTPNYRRQASAVPNDPLYSYQWHYPLINLPTAWDITVGDASAVVAVIDTGILKNHPDLESQLVAGYDFISDSRVSGDGNGIDSDPEDPGDGGAFNVSSFHGTHVAGTIAASSNDGSGVAGVAWGAKIMPLRVLGEGGGSDFDIAQAIRYAAGLSNTSGTVPSNPADIINLSLGGAQSSQSLEDAVSAAQSAGVIVIAAAGNESTSTPSFPAAYSGVISVSAVDLNRELAPYSNFGSSIDVAAPGGDTSQDLNGDGRGDGVLSTAGDDSSGLIRYSYRIYQGTSMAAPHVAGVAALMKTVHPALTPSEFTTALQAGALSRDIGNSGRDDAFGYGLIDAYKAVVEAQNLAGGNGTPVTGDLSINPHSVSFGLSSTTANLYVDEIGSDGLAINSVISSEAWLSVTEADIDSLGFGRYELRAARGSLDPGTYTATIAVRASNGSGAVDITREIDVLIQVLDTSLTGFAGLNYVQLIDVDNDTVVEQLQVEALAGAASFQFSSVPPGRYFIFAGSDMNNNNLICDAGEACGVYPTGEQPLILELDASRSGLDFPVSYPYESPANATAKGQATANSLYQRSKQ